MQRNTSFFSVFQASLVFLLLVLGSHVAVAASPDPTEQIRPFLAKVTATLAEPGLKSKSRQEQSDRMISVIRERFDFREMSKRVLGQQWRNLSDKEQAEFEDLFTQLLQYVYVDKIDDYSGQQIQYTLQRVKGDRAEVQTLLVDKNKSIPIFYIMILRNDQWMIYDVVVEGVSLVRNYMEQFNEILRKNGYSGLIKQLKDKIAELEKNLNKS
ncbi:MAG: ABC transporter substrate-binding protein [Desulfobulbus sp.]|jgi:phospholipid transport system substrate-binding protein|uniref:MlaC/ttg2D family ABC transporter substrate-binding protein n=1 Tax=Desulfobulbus sp. TaxID=895 RepID=UPI00284BBEDF|nr:ABC transporter substrate-binding protein [Desulfobulbus sp.]MDR2550544.1 ABC transporter substrate-binding protein [Desulfobulbus sp.]